MRYFLRVALMLLLPASRTRRRRRFAVPDKVKVDGVPPIPMSIVDGVAPYGQFRQARFLGWHPTRRRILISTAFGNVSQIHEVRSPGGARTQLTFFRDGVTGGASYEPGGRYFVFRKDTSGGGEAMQLFRYDLDSGRITLLTDAKSRHGVPVWSHRRGLIAYSSTRRNGKDRDLWVMNPLEEGSERMIGENSMAAGTRSTGRRTTRSCWRSSRSRDPRRHASGASTSTPGGDGSSRRRPGQPARWTAAQFSADGRSVFALSDRDSEVTRVWKRDLASGAWTPVSEEGVGVEGFAVSPVGSLHRRRRRSRRDERVAARRREHAEATPGAGDPAGIIWNVSWHAFGDRPGDRVCRRSHVPRRVCRRRQERQAGTMDDERDGRRGPGLAAGSRDHSVEEF